MDCPACKKPFQTGAKSCPNCGLTMPNVLPRPTPIGAAPGAPNQPPWQQQPLRPSWPPAPQQTGFISQNDSGNGRSAQLPAELRGFNWGATGVTFWWSIFNKSYIGLLILIPSIASKIVTGNTALAIIFPVLSLAFSIYMGFAGNQLAWQNRRWLDVDDFKRCQGIWGVWGVCLFIFYLVIVAVAFWAAFALKSAISSATP
jgi:hypothetical protein